MRVVLLYHIRSKIGPFDPCFRFMLHKVDTMWVLPVSSAVEDPRLVELVNHLVVAENGVFDLFGIPLSTSLLKDLILPLSAQPALV